MENHGHRFLEIFKGPRLHAEGEDSHMEQISLQEAGVLFCLVAVLQELEGLVSILPF